MTANPSTSNVRGPRRKRRWLDVSGKLLLCGVTVGTLVVGGLWVFADRLSDEVWPYMESGVTNVATYLLCLATAFSLVVWIAVFSRRRWYSRAGWILAIVAAVAIPIILFEPVFSGGLGIRGWRARYWTGKSIAEKGSGDADLSKESAADFPQFLGPNRNGYFDGVVLESDWQSHPPQPLWRRPIGLGWSGFATRNGFAVTMQQDGAMECVSCYRVEDGSLVWNYSIPRRHENVLGGVGPRSTPTIDAGRVYALGAVGDLSCLDGATGKPIWHVDLLDLAGIPVLEKTNSRGEHYQIEQSNVSWGRAASPLIFNDMVIVPLGGKHTLVAFNAKTGSPIWFGGSGQTPSYSSAVAADILGRPQIVISNESSVTGHDAANGGELWSQPHPGSSSGDANTSQATIAGENRFLLSKGYGLGGELIEIVADADGADMSGSVEITQPTFQANSIWKSPRVLKTKLTNPVVRDGFVYAISNEFLECVELANGNRRWRAPTRFGHGQILVIGKHILAHSEDGQLVLAEANPAAYRELGRIDTIEGVCWNTIAMYGDCVLVRSDREAACYRFPVVQVAKRQNGLPNTARSAVGFIDRTLRTVRK